MKAPRKRRQQSRLRTITSNAGECLYSSHLVIVYRVCAVFLWSIPVGSWIVSASSGDDDGGGGVDCSGALDDCEDSFATGIPGDNVDPVLQDCFFDGDTMCENCCGALTPPGCDCFGRCTICSGDTCYDVAIGLANDSCTVDNLDDEDACPRCVKSDECGGGDCDGEDCVLCPGQTEEDLPDSCEGNECPTARLRARPAATVQQTSTAPPAAAWTRSSDRVALA